ncbi:MAG: helix-turn-helix domain-containing protein, partial [Actinomycetota bacterium]
MSNRLRDHVYALDLSPHLRDVLLVLADHAHADGGDARPSVALVAWKLSKHPRTIQRALRQLRARNLIIPTSRPRPGRATVYTLVLFNGACKAPRQEGLFAPSTDDTTDDTGVATDDT